MKIFCCREYRKKPLPFVDRFELDPWQRWRRYGTFPRTLIIHLILLVFSTIQISLLVGAFSAFNINIHYSLPQWVFPENWDLFVGNPLTFPENEYYLHLVEDFNVTFSNVLFTYFELNGTLCEEEEVNSWYRSLRSKHRSRNNTLLKRNSEMVGDELSDEYCHFFGVPDEVLLYSLGTSLPLGPPTITYTLAQVRGPFSSSGTNSYHNVFGSAPIVEEFHSAEDISRWFYATLSSPEDLSMFAQNLLSLRIHLEFMLFNLGGAEYASDDCAKLLADVYFDASTHGAIRVYSETESDACIAGWDLSQALGGPVFMIGIVIICSSILQLYFTFLENKKIVKITWWTLYLAQLSLDMRIYVENHSVESKSGSDSGSKYDARKRSLKTSLKRSNSSSSCRTRSLSTSSNGSTSTASYRSKSHSYNVLTRKKHNLFLELQNSKPSVQLHFLEKRCGAKEVTLWFLLRELWISFTMTHEMKNGPLGGAGASFEYEDSLKALASQSLRRSSSVSKLAATLNSGESSLPLGRAHESDSLLPPQVTVPFSHTSRNDQSTHLLNRPVGYGATGSMTTAPTLSSPPFMQISVGERSVSAESVESGSSASSLPRRLVELGSDFFRGLQTYQRVPSISEHADSQQTFPNRGSNSNQRHDGDYHERVESEQLRRRRRRLNMTDKLPIPSAPYSHNYSHIFDGFSASVESGACDIPFHGLIRDSSRATQGGHTSFAMAAAMQVAAKERAEVDSFTRSSLNQQQKRREKLFVEKRSLDGADGVDSSGSTSNSQSHVLDSDVLPLLPPPVKTVNSREKNPVVNTNSSLEKVEKLWEEISPPTSQPVIHLLGSSIDSSLVPAFSTSTSVDAPTEGTVSSVELHLPAHVSLLVAEEEKLPAASGSVESAPPREEVSSHPHEWGGNRPESVRRALPSADSDYSDIDDSLWRGRSDRRRRSQSRGSDSGSDEDVQERNGARSKNVVMERAGRNTESDFNMSTSSEKRRRHRSSVRERRSRGSLPNASPRLLTSAEVDPIRTQSPPSSSAPSGRPHSTASSPSPPDSNATVLTLHDVRALASSHRFLLSRLATAAALLDPLDTLHLFSLWGLLITVSAVVLAATNVYILSAGDETLGSSPRALLGLSVGLQWISLCRYLRHHARMSIVTRAFFWALPDMCLQILAALPVFVAFSVISVALFGDLTERFDGFVWTFITLFSVLNGDVMRETFQVSTQYLHGFTFWIAQAVLFFFCAFFMYVILKMTLAWVELVYLQIRPSSYGLQADSDETEGVGSKMGSENGAPPDKEISGNGRLFLARRMKKGIDTSSFQNSHSVPATQDKGFNSSPEFQTITSDADDDERNPDDDDVYKLPGTLRKTLIAMQDCIDGGIPLHSAALALALCSDNNTVTGL